MREKAAPALCGDGMISPQIGKNNRGGESMSRSDVELNNAIYEVSRVYSGTCSMKDLLKRQILADAVASLTSKREDNYNGVNGSASKEV